jgi:predicted ATPase/DNA-binding SARP family transcriptional activator
MKAKLIIRLLGGFEVIVDGVPLPGKQPIKISELLTFLILAGGREVRRSSLAQALWPDKDGATSYLRTSLWESRKALGDEASRLLSPTPRTLRLDVSGADIDLIAFDRAIARRDTASLQEAIALYRGPLLPGCLEPWLEIEREVRHQSYIEALQELSARAAGAGDYEQAVIYLRKACAADPYWEPTRRALMEALAHCELISEALQEFHDLRERLHRERNAEPAPETRTVFDRLRAKTRPAPPLPPPPPFPIPPPPLPQPPTSLIGREAALREIQARLHLTRLLTLMGAGGVGKTRLALAIAHEIGAEYADGIWFVELAALKDPEHVARAVAHALHVRAEPPQPLLQTLAEYLVPRSLLLILDNCEHLLDACAELVTALRAACPRLRILTTSRQPLGIMGETTWRVPSLPAPGPAQITAEGAELTILVGSYAAVQLFVERAAMQTSFQLTPDNARTVAAICRLLDGIPFAIELAAARMRLLLPTQILKGLDDRFRLLTGGIAMLPRHQTLWALIDWSYTLLTPEEQFLLRQLAVFRGGFTLEAVEAIATGATITTALSAVTGKIGKIDKDEVSSLLFNLLTSLIDQSLVIAEHGLVDEARYALPETVRQFARYQLTSNREELLVGARHRDFFVALAEAAEPQLRGSGQPHWVYRLEREHDNLRAALDYQGDDAGDAESRLRLAAALWNFWAIRSYVTEGLQRLLDALEHAPVSSPFRAQALVATGVLTDYNGFPEQAIPLLTEALHLARQSGDRWLSGHALLMVAWVHRRIDPICAVRLMGEAEALAREIGDPWLLIQTLSTGGFMALYHDDGDVPQARRRFHEAEPLCRALGDPWLMSEIVYHLGLVSSVEGHSDVAEILFVESIQLSRELGDRRGLCTTLCYLAQVRLRQGDHEAAQRQFMEGLALSIEVNSIRGIEGVLEGMALLAQAQRKPQRAARLLGAAEALRATQKAPRMRLWQPAFDQVHCYLREELGEVRAAAYLGQGQRMTLQQAVNYAHTPEPDETVTGSIT